VNTKILIVANDPAVRNQLVGSFSGVDSRAFSAPDGGEALLQFGLILPDLVILDIPLSGKDRWKTVQRMREMSPVPVIALVSVEDYEGKSESLDRGADSFLTKPFDVQELQARVRALLRRVHGTTRPARQQTAVSLCGGRSF
jgi:DNA-binding response OmpR family regulator